MNMATYIYPLTLYFQQTTEMMAIHYREQNPDLLQRNHTWSQYNEKRVQNLSLSLTVQQWKKGKEKIMNMVVILAVKKNLMEGAERIHIRQ